MKCKHNWHLVENLDGFGNYKNLYYRFICDKCGNLKEVKRGYLIKEKARSERE